MGAMLTLGMQKELFQQPDPVIRRYLIEPRRLRSQVWSLGKLPSSTEDCPAAIGANVDFDYSRRHTFIEEPECLFDTRATSSILPSPSFLEAPNDGDATSLQAHHHRSRDTTLAMASISHDDQVHFPFIIPPTDLT